MAATIGSAVAGVTLKDVARAADVHPSTASRALDPAKVWLVSADTRTRVLDAARALGYRPHVVASSLRRRRTDTIGLVVPDLANPYIAPVVRGIENALEGRGLIAMIAETQDDPARSNRVLEHLQRRRVDAIVTTAAREGDVQVLRKLARTTPTVLAVRPLERLALTTVTHDDRMGARLAAEHLAALGHRRVVQLTGPLDVANFARRRAAFLDAAGRHGMEVVDPGLTATRATVQEGERQMRVFMQRQGPRVTAIFAHNDVMALGALRVLRALDVRCPQDMSLVGYNDMPAAEFTEPGLTTVGLPGYELGRLAAEMAVTLIEQPATPPTQLSLPPELVVRDSTAVPDLARDEPAVVAPPRSA